MANCQRLLIHMKSMGQIPRIRNAPTEAFPGWHDHKSHLWLKFQATKPFLQRKASPFKTKNCWKQEFYGLKKFFRKHASSFWTQQPGFKSTKTVLITFVKLMVSLLSQQLSQQLITKMSTKHTIMLLLTEIPIHTSDLFLNVLMMSTEERSGTIVGSSER